MLDTLKRLPVMLKPNASRTVVRPFNVEDPQGFAVEGHPRSQRIVDRVMALDEHEVRRELALAIQSLRHRHRDIDGLFKSRFDSLDSLTMDRAKITREQALLIGSYFSEEFSFESAALFNPSAVPHPDQSGLGAGDLRFVLSLRGIGEGHISSLTFRTGVWKANGDVEIDDLSIYAVGPRIERTEGEKGELIAHLKWDEHKAISETVIYPFMPSQGRGIEDVRLVQFTDDNGKTDFRGTFTSFDGSEVRQGMMRTQEFKDFEMRGVQGQMYSGKGMALFPRKIDGDYYMLGRQDNENLWLLRSEDLYTWNGGQKILGPKWPWEFMQMGNCGSPIEIDEGWLVMTHGVGLVRNYCIGACLLDKADPSRVLARVTRPILEPDETMRDGYVPNVVYSCGAMLRDRTLLLPYGVADNFAAFATVEVDAILKAMA